jgi:hypothetical protein
MKIVITLLLFATTVNGQQNFKNGCIGMFSIGNEKAFMDSVISYTPGYKFLKDTSLYGTNSHIYVYTNIEGDELQFWFSKVLYGEDANRKIAGTPMLSFDKIVGQFLTVEKIYLNYYGRETDIGAVTKNGRDTWKPVCNGKEVWVRFRTIQRKGYWEIDL